jgi:hypothetical protein
LHFKFFLKNINTVAAEVQSLQEIGQEVQVPDKSKNPTLQTHELVLRSKILFYMTEQD